VWLSSFVFETITVHQYGSYRNGSTTELTLDEHSMNHSLLDQQILDFKTAYDAVRWEVLYTIITEIGIYISLIKMCMHDV
jgi:hypothetical protein